MTIRATDLTKKIPATYRQLHVWVRLGHIRTVEDGKMEFTSYEAQIATTIAHLVEVGMVTSRAAGYARKLADAPEDAIDIPIGGGEYGQIVMWMPSA